MALKKVLKGKQATLPRRNDFTKEFQKDWHGLQHIGINLASLTEAMSLLVANEGPLPAEWRDHPLKGARRQPFISHRPSGFLRSGTVTSESGVPCAEHKTPWTDSSHPRSSY